MNNYNAVGHNSFSVAPNNKHNGTSEKITLSSET